MTYDDWDELIEGKRQRVDDIQQSFDDEHQSQTTLRKDSVEVYIKPLVGLQPAHVENAERERNLGYRLTRAKIEMEDAEEAMQVAIDTGLLKHGMENAFCSSVENTEFCVNVQGTLCSRV